MSNLDASRDFRRRQANCLVSLETSGWEKIDVKLGATGGYARVTGGCAGNFAVESKGLAKKAQAIPISSTHYHCGDLL